MEKLGACLSLASHVWFSVERLVGMFLVSSHGYLSMEVAGGKSIKTEKSKNMAEYFNPYTDNSIQLANIP